MGRRFSILGDSISTFEGYIPEQNRLFYDAHQQEATGVRTVEDTWWWQVIAEQQGELLANGSFSGSTVQGSGFPAAEDPSRALQILGPEGERPDDIVIFIGINDYGWGSPEAQVAARSAAMPKNADLEAIPEGVAGAASPDAAQAFGAAYQRLLTNLRAVAPEARIWCVALVPGRETGSAGPDFCHCLRGVSIDAYNEAIAQACQTCDTQFVAINEFGLDYEASDGTHPTAVGMAQLAEMVNAFMSKRPVDPAIVSPALASKRRCEQTSAMDCPWARSISNEWSCVCEKPGEEMPGEEIAETPGSEVSVD